MERAWTFGGIWVRYGGALISDEMRVYVVCFCAANASVL